MPDLASDGKEQLTPAVEAPSQEDEYLAAEREAQREMEKTEEDFLEEPVIETAPTTPLKERAPVTASPVAVPVQKDEQYLEVEKILEEGLGPFYQSLPESARPKFKEKGELATREISQMVRSLQLNFKRVLQLIRDWLLTIPKVNKFFLEQEAKIKTDKIAELVEELKEERYKQP